MPGLDDLLSFVLRAVEVTPAYAQGRCLVVRSGAEACRACLDVCPHEAVRIDEQVELDAVNCTGCGLCVRACPSEALTAPPKVEPGPALRCSRVAGDAASVRCLAQLSAADLVRLVGDGESVTLARGECAGCKVGGAAVPEVVAATAARAGELQALHGRRLLVNVSLQARLDTPTPTRRLSRRDLFRGGAREVARGAAEALAPLEALLPGPEGGPGGHEPPPEASRRLRLIAAARPAHDALVPWRLPRVADGCIMCPACTRACPTGALERDFSGPQAVLRLKPDACVGCEACIAACPVRVMSMDDEVSWGELSGGASEAFRSGPERLGTGAVPR